MSIPANQSFPAGGTWFDTLRKSFVDVPIDEGKDNAIATTEFLEAAESLTTLFDLLGSVAFTPVKNDMIGNIKKVRDRQLAAPADSETIQALVLNELKTKKHIATEGLLWLVRGLDFTSRALRHNLSHQSEELSTSFRHAYSASLKPHHSFLVKPIFSAAMSATPYKADFMKKMGDSQTKIDAETEKWLAALERCVRVLGEGEKGSEGGFLGRKEAKW